MIAVKMVRSDHQLLFNFAINSFPVNISKNSDIISHDFRNDAVTLFYFTAFLVCHETIIENRISGSIRFIFRICNGSLSNHSCVGCEH
jgi:hypothetical protein